MAGVLWVKQCRILFTECVLREPSRELVSALFQALMGRMQSRTCVGDICRCCRIQDLWDGLDQVDR